MQGLWLLHSISSGLAKEFCSDVVETWVGPALSFHHARRIEPGAEGAVDGKVLK